VGSQAPRGRSDPVTNAPLVYTADELAELLGVDRKTIYDFATRGEIPCKRLGRRILFPRAAIAAWLVSR
jgi:excisionase family DNA binding protein